MADIGLKFTQLLKENCITSDLNKVIHFSLSYKFIKNEMEGLKYNDKYHLISSFLESKDKLSYDINTFFLNGVIIELNSR